MGIQCGEFLKLDNIPNDAEPKNGLCFTIVIEISTLTIDTIVHSESKKKKKMANNVIIFSKWLGIKPESDWNACGCGCGCMCAYIKVHSFLLFIFEEFLHSTHQKGCAALCFHLRLPSIHFAFYTLPGRIFPLNNSPSCNYNICFLGRQLFFFVPSIDFQTKNWHRNDER